MSYFTERALMLEEDSQKQADKLSRKVKALLKKSEREIKSKIDEIYREYGAENKLTLKQAKKFLKSEKVTVLNKLLTSIRDNLDIMYSSQLELFSDVLGGVYEHSYKNTAFMVQDSVKVYSSLQVIDKNRITSILKRKNAGDTFSNRIWKDHRTKLFTDVQVELARAVATGKTNKEIAKEVTKKYGSSYKNAERLVRTESNFFHNQGILDSYSDSFVEEYEYNATLDKRTSSYCRELDGKIFKIEDAQTGINYPPMHPRCRSITVPHFDFGNYKERMMRNKDGKSVIEESLSYEEWEEKYGD
ncbi:MAG: minor capsid protein [Fusobacteriaceae bacterium]